MTSKLTSTLPFDPLKRCPVFGKSPCSDNGLREPRKGGRNQSIKYRPFCAIHTTHKRRYDRLVKDIERFHNETGINLCAEHTVTSAPPPRVLTRVGGSRVATVEHKEMTKKIRDLEQKLADSEVKRLDVIQQKRQLRQTTRRLSESHKHALAIHKQEAQQARAENNKATPVWIPTALESQNREK